MVVTTPQRVHQDTLTCLLTAELSTGQLTSALAPLLIWLSPLRPLVVSYGDVAAVRWTATAASMSTDHQPHDRTVGDQGGASSTDGQTSVD